MIKEQKEKNRIIFPESEIERAENIVRIEIRCMEGRVRELKKTFHLKTIEDFMMLSPEIGDSLFRYYLLRICNDGKICTLSEALKRIDMSDYRSENLKVLKNFIEDSNKLRSAAKAITLFKEFFNKKDVYKIIWMLSNIETAYITVTTDTVKLFNRGYIPTPLDLYEEWCEL